MFVLCNVFRTFKTRVIIYQKGEELCKYDAFRGHQSRIFNRANSYRTRSYKQTSAIREEFVNYFRSRGHKVVRSSPVVPFCDPSVTFVNAGMNQFKGVFLGKSPPPAPRAVNSQKCIRVGGKHNDLEVVGSDGYHHTFFEMLGSWSFGDYFKKDACRFAWKQLTEVFNLDPKKMYVTYYGGGDESGLEADHETRDIWLEMGVPKSHVLPFGARDNLWEMGPTGPCGPCTEIHYDFLGRSNAAEWVNAGHPDVIELWNLVFIQFERCEDGSLVPLPSFHVDTGMGLERLASVLQGVTSTYDTDIFQPLFSLIHKSTSAPQYCGKFGLEDTKGLDTGYRILADHSRMITVAIADGMLPDHNHRLRRVIRRALSVSKDLFSRKERAHELLFDLCTVVADSLEGPYPGLISRLDCIKAVLSHENLMLSKLQSDSANKWNEILLERPELAHIDIKSSPGILKVLKELEVSSNRGMQEIDDEKAFVLYDTYGLNEAAIRELGTAFDLDFDSEGFHRKLKEARDKSRKSGNFNSLEEMVPSKAIIELCARGVTPTKDDLKYHYSRDSLGRYQFAAVEAVIQAIIYKGKVVSHVEAEIQEQEDFGVVLDQTCFYHESGGQVADTGFIIPLNGNGQKMFVKDVQASGGYVVHWGTVMKDQNGSSLSENSPQFQVGKTVKLIINEENRLKIMRNHTAVHCLGAALRHSAPATAQRSSLVTPTHFSYQFSVYGIQEARPATGNKLSKQKSETVNDANDFSWQKFLESAEKKVRTVVSGKQAPVRRKTLTSIQLLDEMSRASNKLEEIATVPGEVYPESGVHLVEVMVSSSSGVLDNLAEIKVEDTKGNDNLLMWSREPCCGTHVLDATDILDFCLVDVESAGSTSRIVKAVTGNNAISAKARGEQFLLKIKDLERRVNEFLKNAPDDKDSERRVSAQYLVDTFENELKSLKTSQGMSDQSLADSIPFIDRCHSMELISTLESSLKEYKKGIDHLRIEQEILSAVESLNGLRYLVHCIHPGHSQSDKVLQMATKFCPKDLPVLVFAAVNDGKAVKARCVVPKELATDVFNAEKWITPVMKIFKGVGSAPKGQDPRYIFNMREKNFLLIRQKKNLQGNLKGQEKLPRTLLQKLS